MDSRFHGNDENTPATRHSRGTGMTRAPLPPVIPAEAGIHSCFHVCFQLHDDPDHRNGRAEDIEDTRAIP